MKCSGTRRFAANVRFQPLCSRSARLPWPVRAVRDLGIYTDSGINNASARRWNCIELFCGFSTNSQHSPVGYQVISPVARRLNGSDTSGSTTLACLSSVLLDWLQSVLHATDPLSSKYDHVTALLRDLHWLRVPEKIAHRLEVLAFHCQHGTAPTYLSVKLTRVADADSRRRLRSSNTVALVIPWSKHSTIGDHAFPVTSVWVWNNLPPFISSSPSLLVFKRELKTALHTLVSCQQTSYPEQT